MIELVYVTHPSERDLRWRYKTIRGAAKKARELVTDSPRLDSDGCCLVNSRNGHCLFVNGCLVTDLFPELES